MPCPLALARPCSMLHDHAHAHAPTPAPHSRSRGVPFARNRATGLGRAALAKGPRTRTTRAQKSLRLPGPPCPTRCRIGASLLATGHRREHAVQLLESCLVRRYSKPRNHVGTVSHSFRALLAKALNRIALHHHSVGKAFIAFIAKLVLQSRCASAPLFPLAHRLGLARLLEHLPLRCSRA